MILGLTTAGFYDDLDPWQVGALRKVVVFRTLAQEQLENLADALEAVMKSGPGWARMGQGRPRAQARE